MWQWSREHIFSVQKVCVCMCVCVCGGGHLTLVPEPLVGKYDRVHCHFLHNSKARAICQTKRDESFFLATLVLPYPHFGKGNPLG